MVFCGLGVSSHTAKHWKYSSYTGGLAPPNESCNLQPRKF